LILYLIGLAGKTPIHLLIFKPFHTCFIVPFAIAIDDQMDMENILALEAIYILSLQEKTGFNIAIVIWHDSKREHLVSHCEILELSNNSVSKSSSNQ